LLAENRGSSHHSTPPPTVSATASTLLAIKHREDSSLSDARTSLGNRLEQIAADSGLPHDTVNEEVLSPAVVAVFRKGKPGEIPTADKNFTPDKILTQDTIVTTDKILSLNTILHASSDEMTESMISSKKRKLNSTVIEGNSTAPTAKNKKSRKTASTTSTGDVAGASRTWNQETQRYGNGKGRSTTTLSIPEDTSRRSHRVRDREERKLTSLAYQFQLEEEHARKWKITSLHIPVIKALLKEEHLVWNAVIPDGSCFFQSISYCMYGTAVHHKEIRQTVVQMIYDKFCNGLFSIEQFCGNLVLEPDWVLDHINEGNLVISKYVEKMSRVTEYATELELATAEELYALPVSSLYYLF
jgi:hypothetical protein